jgi:uncharacterized protein
MMNEQQVIFKAEGLRLEGLYHENDGPQGIVITHPHPQMGGAMSNNVVEALALTFAELRYSTIRFNFRGVGQSEGRYDNGRGEQDDVLGAAAYLAVRGKEVKLAGYSFGAWINARIISRHSGFSGAVFVSPPLGMMKFESKGLKGKVGLIVCGDRDPFCPVATLSVFSQDLECSLEIIDGADHFFFGFEQKIISRVRGYLQTMQDSLAADV